MRRHRLRLRLYNRGGFMGQTSSSAADRHGELSLNLSRRISSSTSSKLDSYGIIIDHTSDIPDECLAYVFQFLSSADRTSVSLVCRRWFVVDGQSRHRLSLNVQANVIPRLPSIFARFDSVTKLALRCDRRSMSISDDAFVSISVYCRNLTRLKLRGCREITEIGMAAFAKNCKNLRKFSCGSCVFGSRGLNAVLRNCSSLEELSVKRLREGGVEPEPIEPGLSGLSLKTVSLKELYNGQCFAPLIAGSKNIKTLKLFRCLGDWDKLFETIVDNNNNDKLVEVHLERLQVSDIGLSALSNCSNLEILHIVKSPECTSLGLLSVAENCKRLRKLHIDGWRTNRIGDEGLLAVAKHCVNLQELVLIGINPTALSLTAIASNCKNLERLALCTSETIHDAEILGIADKCVALRKLCIKGCQISDRGMESLAWGFPKLVKVKVKKCRGVTSEIAEWLQANRGSLVVNLDEPEVEAVDASGSDVGVQENNGPEYLPLLENTEITDADAVIPNSNGRTKLAKFKFSLFTFRNFVACTFGWSNANIGSSNN